MPFIAALVRVLIGGLIAAGPSIIARVCVGLGIGLVSFAGLSEAVVQLGNMLNERAAQMPSDVFNYLQYCGLTTCINIHISALTAWATIKSSGSVLSFLGAKK